MKTLIIASTGIGKKDISVESIEKINSTEALLNFSSHGSNFLSKFVKIKIININEKLSYEGNAFKKINIIFKTIKKLFLSLSRISLVVSGNPSFLNIFVQEIVKRVKKMNINVEVIPAVSSIDYVINIITMHINPDLRSYIILTSPFQLPFLYEYKFLKHDIIVMNFHTINSSTTKDKKRILELLESIPEKECYLIKHNFKTSKNIIKKRFIKNIKEIISHIDNETTIYIPFDKKYNVKRHK
ncbi:MAG: SAM-dependent methyltransferase [Elusimicrobiales bacterium]